MEQSFAEMLKEARTSRGWTQEDLANQLGVRQQSVQKWESGKALPRPARQEALMRALGVHMRATEPRPLLVREPTERLARPPRVSNVTILRGSSVRVQVEARMAEIESFLPEKLVQNLAPPATPGFGFATDYLSNRLAANIIFDARSDRLYRPLWDLATLRQIHINLLGEERIYALIIISSDVVKTLQGLNRLSLDAQMHNIVIRVVSSSEEAALIIKRVEEGENPADVHHIDESE